MYLDTSLDREGAPTRAEAERDEQIDRQASRPRARVLFDDDPWAADLRNNPDRDDEVVLQGEAGFEADGFIPRNAIAPF